MVPTAMRCLEAERTFLMRRSGTKTKYPGVFKVGTGTYRLRVKWTDPRTGKRKEADRVVECRSAQEAARRRAELLEEFTKQEQEAANRRVKVGEYAQSWMRSKVLKVDPKTARTYADALDLHILPAFGDFYYDALTRQDVQSWVDQKLREGGARRNGERKPYARNTVAQWLIVLRAMTNEAMEDLDLARNPTKRIKLPEKRRRTERNTLTADELGRFLSAVQDRYPQHMALVGMLAFTGLRFCHASALRWDDWDEKANVIRVQRKQVRGNIGPISRKKQAPAEVPVEPELAAILRWHRLSLSMNLLQGGDAGWMFPSSKGGPLCLSTLNVVWRRCLPAVGVNRRFTIHGLRYTFTDLTRRATGDAVVRRALVGHVTEAMQDHYSNVALDEKRSAIAGVHRQVAESGFKPGENLEIPTLDTEVGTEVGTEGEEVASEPASEDASDQDD